MDQVARTVLGLLLLAAVACLVPLVDGVRQARAVLWSAARGAVQLLAVGLLLGAGVRGPGAGARAVGSGPPPSRGARPSPGRWCSPPGPCPWGSATWSPWAASPSVGP